MNKETVEKAAANEWLDSFYQKEKEYNKVGRNKCSPQLGFIAGAEWQKEQAATDAIEFFKWVNNHFNECHSHYEDNVKISSYVHKSLGGVPQRIEKLYELYKQSKK